MFDLQYDEKASRPRVGMPRSLKHKLIGLVLGGGALWAVLCLSASSYSSAPYTCAACRADKVDYQFFLLRWSREEETECSQWYRDNVERAHAHAWIARTHCRRIGIPGLWRGYGCVIGGPLTGLSTRVQIEIYQHFADRLEAKRLFVRLGQRDTDASRLWDSLMGWIDQNYPGTWHDWWEQEPVARRSNFRDRGAGPTSDAARSTFYRGKPNRVSARTGGLVR